MKLQTRIFTGFMLILLTSTLISFFIVLRLYNAGGTKAMATELRHIAEQAIEVYQTKPDSPAADKAGKDAVLAAYSLAGRTSLAEREGLIQLAGLYGTFLVVQALLLGLLAWWSAHLATAPLRALLGGFRDAGLKPTYRLPQFKGQEWALLSEGFNQLLERLEEKERMMTEQARSASWKDISAFLSHQLKNPLTSLGLALANLEALTRETDYSSESLDQNKAENAKNDFKQALATIASEGKRIDKLVRTFRSSTTVNEPILSQVKLSKILDLAISHFDPKRLNLEYEANDEQRVFADERLLAEAFVNLFTNSLEAWEQAKMQGPVPIYLRSSLEPNRLRIDIEDGLSNIPDHIYESILEKPFTNKAGGTGLGLILVKSVISAHDGSIVRHRSKTGGLAFTIFLPQELESDEKSPHH